MNPIRVLIVDDSVIARRLITNALSAEPDISVVGTAGTGALAIAKIPHLSPDVVVLDSEMSDMDGVATLKVIRELHPRLPVLMTSTESERGARVTFEALLAGANDYALWPAAHAGEQVEREIAALLVPKLKLLGRRADRASDKTRPVRARKPRLRVPPTGPSRALPRIVVVTADAGTPHALFALIPNLPHDLPVPVVIAQAVPTPFTRCLTERLADRSAIKVVESEGNELLEPGTVYLIAGAAHLGLSRGEGERVYTRVSAGGEQGGAADTLFAAAADVFGEATLGVVLASSGLDGKRGAEAIVQAGGRIIAQSGTSGASAELPRAVEEVGLCEAVLPISEIALAICDAVRPRDDQRAAHGR